MGETTESTWTVLKDDAEAVAHRNAASARGRRPGGLPARALQDNPIQRTIP